MTLKEIPLELEIKATSLLRYQDGGIIRKMTWSIATKNLTT